MANYPRVYDVDGNEKNWAWLVAKYHCALLDAGEVAKFKLVRIDEAKGPAVYTVQVRDVRGNPQPDQPVARWWPGVADADGVLKLLDHPELKTRLRDYCIFQKTTSGGDTGFGYGSGSVIHDDGGVDLLWVLSPSLPSDGLDKVGWLGGTDHLGPTKLTFQIIEPGSVTPDPEPGESDITSDKAFVRELILARMAAKYTAANAVKDAFAALDAEAAEWAKRGAA